MNESLDLRSKKKKLEIILFVACVNHAHYIGFLMIKSLTTLFLLHN